jgi:hypothetical protein
MTKPTNTKIKAKPCAELLQYYQDQLQACQERAVDRDSLYKRNLALLEEIEKLKVELKGAYTRLAELEARGKEEKK